MLQGLRIRLGELLRLGADSLLGSGVPSARASDDAGWNLVTAGDGPSDRGWTEIREDLTDALEAWRRNAWVRQIVRLLTAYVVGDGITVTSERVSVGRWVDKFWSHPQNRIDDRLAAWSDELCRSGELFLALFPNQVDGMQYVRVIPASQIQRVETDAEDYERETGYLEIVPGQIEPRRWPSQHEAQALEPCLVHFTVNKPIGATRGESDLTPVLPWAKRYTDWLRDRVRYNKIRSELATAEIVLDDDTQVEAKKQQYRANPPTRGSIYVHGRGEELKFPAANIAAFEAKDDGRALRLAMATSGDIPLHFFSEGDTATRATAVEMGDPTHRFYRQRQRELGGMLVDLAEVAYRRHLAVLRGIKEKGLGSWLRRGDLGLEYEAADISRADNKAMADAARTIVEAFAVMKENGWITDELAIRLAFKFAGEVLTDEEVSEILEAGTNDDNDGDVGSGGTNGASGGSDAEQGGVLAALAAAAEQVAIQGRGF
jgi:hypothetical protein